MIATGGVLRGIAATRKPEALALSKRREDEKQKKKRRRKAKRQKKPDMVVVKGHVHMCSFSGVLVIVGILILIVGITMTFVGYWPYNNIPLEQIGKLSNRTTAGPEWHEASEGLLMAFVSRHLQSERLKLLGPLLMGIGLFVFICANAVLHENRDRETRIIHMRDIYSTVIDLQAQRVQGYGALNACPLVDCGVPCLDMPYAEKLAATSLPTFLCPQTSLSPEGQPTCIGSLMCGDDIGVCEARCLDDCNKKASSPCPCEKAELTPLIAADCGTSSIVSSSINAFTLPIIKLNNCVIDEADVGSITEEIVEAKTLTMEQLPSYTTLSTAVTTPCPPLSSSAECSDGRPPLLEQPDEKNADGVSLVPSAFQGELLSPALRRRGCPSTSLSKSLDLTEDGPLMKIGVSAVTTAKFERNEQRKHPSWPCRLDSSNSKGYMKLDDGDDAADRFFAIPSSSCREYNNHEKLMMISRSHNNLSFEGDSLPGEGLLV
uniref:transmembrane protein 200A-like isoform X2 n=1 Tax=Myxine glutinosa TaxID=7769 RepID=UPI00358FFD61